MTELKRCPFCNGDDVVVDFAIIKEGIFGENEYRVICNGCGALGPPCRREIDAIEYWSDRGELCTEAS